MFAPSVVRAYRGGVSSLVFHARRLPPPAGALGFRRPGRAYFQGKKGTPEAWEPWGLAYTETFRAIADEKPYWTQDHEITRFPTVGWLADDFPATNRAVEEGRNAV